MTEPLVRSSPAQAAARDITVILNLGSGSASKLQLREQIEQTLSAQDRKSVV